MSSTSLSPDNIPSVSIDFMNQTHKEEVAIVNILMEKIQARLSGEQNATEISDQLKAWFGHTEAHFARENDLMQKTAFPAYPVHSAEHEKALNLMQTVIEDWHHNKNVERLYDYVFNQWTNWFIAHVNSMDKVTAEYALMSGYTEE